ncbi:MAG: YeeE/YedE family protein [Pseudomonadota bacterium]
MLNALIGGTLIGLAALLLRLSTGRIAGISGLLGQALRGRAAVPWLFVLGLGAGGWLAQGLIELPAAALQLPTTADGWALLLCGGLLVGVGTRLGSGCTSGHGVCGIARLSPRSIAATMTFMVAGMAIATLPGYLL